MVSGETEISTIISILALASTLVLGLLQVFIRPKQSKAQETNLVVDAANKAVEAMTKGFDDRVSFLEKTIEDLRKEISDRDELIDDLKVWAEQLVAQVKEAGKEPVKFTRKQK